MDIVRHALIRDGVIDGAVVWTPLRGGRTNLVWRLDGPTRSMVCKLHRDNGGTPLFPNDARSEACATAAMDEPRIGPPFRGCHPTPAGTCLLYDHVEGRPWRPDPTGPGGQIGEVASVATLLSRVHRQQPIGGMRRVSASPGDVIGQGDAMMAALDPPLVRRLMPYRPAADQQRAARPVFLHGDPVPGNIIVGVDGLRLIDWQCPALGDPIHDLALFLSPAMQTLAHGRPLSRAERQHFLHIYGDADLTVRMRRCAPALGWRMAVYCAWRMARGHLDYSPALEAELQQLDELG